MEDVSRLIYLVLPPRIACCGVGLTQCVSACCSISNRNPYLVYVFRNLASRIVFCVPETLEDGSTGSRYAERSLQEGDFVMVERAPSLSKFNNQPFRLAYWDIEYIGIHPKVFSYFYGDYNRNKYHIYAIGNHKSIEESLI